MKLTDGYSNDKNIYDVSYLTIKYILTSIKSLISMLDVL